MFVRNCWYVAAWSHEVGPADLLARTLLNQPMVFYRIASGEVVAMDDRCSHRGAPLSLGRREGDDLRCLYHGLKYDCSGRCVEAPAQEAVSPRMKVRTYPVVERDNWIWIWPGNAELACTAFEIGTWSQPGWPKGAASPLSKLVATSVSLAFSAGGKS